jgi:methylsterol monooxygenase
MVRYFFKVVQFVVFNRFNQCYGVIGVLDSIHGTDVAFRKSKSHNRHVFMLTLKSAREAFPDESNHKKK